MAHSLWNHLPLKHWMLPRTLHHFLWLKKGLVWVCQIVSHFSSLGITEGQILITWCLAAPLVITDLFVPMNTLLFWWNHVPPALSTLHQIVATDKNIYMHIIQMSTCRPLCHCTLLVEPSSTYSPHLPHSIISYGSAKRLSESAGLSANFLCLQNRRKLFCSNECLCIFDETMCRQYSGLNLVNTSALHMYSFSL